MILRYLRPGMPFKRRPCVWRSDGSTTRAPFNNNNGLKTGPGIKYRHKHNTALKTIKAGRTYLLWDIWRRRIRNVSIPMPPTQFHYLHIFGTISNVWRYAARNLLFFLHSFSGFRPESGTKMMSWFLFLFLFLSPCAKANEEDAPLEGLMGRIWYANFNFRFFVGNTKNLIFFKK